MDRALFTSMMTGTLVDISTPVYDVAFVPNPLPVEWSFPASMWPALARAREELARLDGAGRHLSNPELILSPLKRREALTSSSLEGTYATAEELLLFEAASKVGQGQGRNEVTEVFNYGAALEVGLSLLGELPFCLRLIREMHRRLMQGVRGEHARPGEFRTGQVHIGSDRRFVPPPPDLVMQCLDGFERSMHLETQVDPLVWCYMLHYQFECIHPFSDGNGRVGRLLLCLMISRYCTLSRPWLYMSPWFDRHKDEYINCMFRVSTHGDWASWIDFCLRGTVAQSKDALVRLERLITLRTDFARRVAESRGNTRLQLIVDYLFDKVPVLTAPAVVDLLNVTFPTAQKDLEKLIELEILVGVDSMRPKAYYAPAIVTAGMQATDT